mmetsp:Transcript_30997/g.82190  ORF Transcript_30997/g.82190 Transcript_30997/m.82190 type:complete len:423 (-) Transcript_30997:1082-2350(-)
MHDEPGLVNPLLLRLLLLHQLLSKFVVVWRTVHHNAVVALPLLVRVLPRGPLLVPHLHVLSVRAVRPVRTGWLDPHPLLLAAVTCRRRLRAAAALGRSMRGGGRDYHTRALAQRRRGRALAVPRAQQATEWQLRQARHGGAAWARRAGRRAARQRYVVILAGLILVIAVLALAAAAVLRQRDPQLLRQALEPETPVRRSAAPVSLGASACRFVLVAPVAVLSAQGREQRLVRQLRLLPRRISRASKVGHVRRERQAVDVQRRCTRRPLALRRRIIRVAHEQRGLRDERLQVAAAHPLAEHLERGRLQLRRIEQAAAVRVHRLEHLERAPVPMLAHVCVEFGPERVEAPRRALRRLGPPRRVVRRRNDCDRKGAAGRREAALRASFRSLAHARRVAVLRLGRQTAARSREHPVPLENGQPLLA